GAIMQRVLGLTIATLAFSSLSGGPAIADISAGKGGQSFDQARHRGVPIDVTALLTAAKGAPPMICSMAANSIRNWGWGDWNDAPATPLAFAKVVPSNNEFDSESLPPADIQQLLAGLASDDACFR